jgi:hypothetical protein
VSIANEGPVAGERQTVIKPLRESSIGPGRVIGVDRWLTVVLAAVLTCLAVWRRAARPMAFRLIRRRRVTTQPLSGRVGADPLNCGSIKALRSEKLRNNERSWKSS